MKNCDKLTEQMPHARLLASENTNCAGLCEGLELEVFQSNAGYYIGTYHPEEGPTCRVTDYFPTREAAQAELDDAKKCAHV